MELKLFCDCGQKYAFDVEPVNNQMPFVVNCPTCGVDGTGQANIHLAEMVPVQPIVAKPTGGLRINMTAPAELPPAPIVNPMPVTPPPLRQAPAVKAQKAEREYSLGRGILGAFLGTLLGLGIVFGFTMLTGIRFPLMGTLIGALSGYGAKYMANGTDIPLGVIAGVIALVVTGGTLFLFFGAFAIFSVFTLLISAGMAYKIAG